MDFSLFMIYVISIVVLIITPGPVISLVINVSTNNSKKVLTTIIGTNAASLIYISIASLSITGFLTINENFVHLLSLAGSFFITYVSIKILTSYYFKIKRSKIETNHNDTQVKTNTGGFLAGFLMAISNPKDIIFFISFFPQFILITENIQTSIMILSTSWIFFDFLILILCSYILKKQSDKAKNIIELLSGLILLTISLTSVYYNFKSFVL